MKKVLAAVGAAFGMLILILDAQTALTGAREGLRLCVHVLIPSLFPFFVLSGILTGSLLGAELPFLGPLGQLCGVPKGAESLLVAGFLGGYPVGAKNIADSCKNGGLSQEDGTRLLGFCNNAGPAFIFGLLGQQFEHPAMAWLLWAIHIISALTVGFLTRKSSEPVTIPKRAVPTIHGIVMDSITAMASTCGWVVLFRILTGFWEHWFLWRFPLFIRLIITGLLELTCGCVNLSQLAHPGIRFLTASIFLSLGGCCVAMQTVSVVAPLSIKGFLAGKLLQCVISAALSCIVLQLLYGFCFSAFFFALSALFFIFLAKHQICSRKTTRVHV